MVKTTTLYIFGVPIYRHKFIGEDDAEVRRPCGFEIYGGGDCPVDDEPEDDEDFETFIIEPYGKK